MNLQKRAMGRLLACLPLLSLVGAIAQTAPAASPAAPAPIPGAIQVISFGGGFNLPLWAAKDQGFFKKHGLLLDLLYTQGSGETMQAVIAGDAQLTFGTPPSVLPMVQAGRLKALAQVAPVLGVFVVVIVGIYGGWANPTEAAAIGAAACHSCGGMACCKCCPAA